MSNIGKRFTDPSVWEKPYFSALDTKQRLFWLYLNNRCDLSGVFQLHFPVDTAYLGFQIDRTFIKTFIEAVNSDAKRIEPLEGQRLWLRGFIRYQQVGEEGSLSTKAGPHKSIVKKLKEHGIYSKAVEDDPELFSNYTGEVTETTEPPPDDSNKDNKGKDTLTEGYAKGYSSSNSSSNGKSSSKGKNHSSPPDLISKAQSVLNAYPKKNKGGSDLPLLADIEDVMKDLKTDGVKDPESYLLNEIDKLNRKDAPKPNVFFSELKQRKEVPF
ncbi:hypothetical protein [Halalkalibaculum sp. DA384]|uniref:hypothetical protein n=1 Tax=Halalkalibaculum sp. DA384 TaxID=3373606 RepID=UPI0037549E2A